MEKQIEEMERDLIDSAEHETLFDIDFYTTSKNLINKGYRKVEQGEWIYHEAIITDDGFISVYACSNCNACVYEEDFHQDYFHKNYCGNCGAKMKGE